MKWLNLVIMISICVVKCLGMSRSELEEFSNFLEMTSQLDLNVKSKGPDEDYDEEEIVSDHAWEDSGKFEGDLILNERQRRLLIADVAEGLARNGLQDSTKRWPNNEVIYYIQREHFSIGQVQAIQQGIDDLAQASCVKFTPYKKGDRDAVVIQGSRRGCFSQVGYQGGYQVLNLSGRHPVGRGCFRHGTVVHELLHALGFYHMQSSPDRDDYIDVLWQNIVQPARHNFRKYNSFAVSDFGVGYDYESVLHYSRKAFSSNGQDTLVPKQSGAEIGQRVGMSQKDIEKLNKMYCDADFNDASSDDDSALKKPVVTKKTAKNKPFDGHGIGYHQGKTVVIKIEPAVELYRLPTLPKLHNFDFSKAAQAMSPALTEGSGNGIVHAPSITPSLNEFHKPTISQTLTHVKDKANEGEYVNEVHFRNIDKAPRVNNIKSKNYKNVLSTENTDLKDFSEEVIHDIGEEFKKLNAVHQMFPTHTYFNTDYSKYYNPERNPEKDSEIAKVDKLFSSQLIQVKDVANEPRQNTQFEMIPPEFQSSARRNELKNMKENTTPVLETRAPLMGNIFLRDSYPLREKYYSENEKTKPELKSYTKHLAPKRNHSDKYYDYGKSDEDYSPFQHIPLNEDWYNQDQYKQNPNNHYNKEAYTKLNDDQKQTHNAEHIHVSRHYPISEYSQETDENRKPYSLFGSPVPLTQKWYKMDSNEHQHSHEPYYEKDNGNR